MNADQILLGIYLGLDAYKLVRDDAWVRTRIAEIHKNANSADDILAGMQALRREAAEKAKADIAAMES